MFGRNLHEGIVNLGHDLMVFCDARNSDLKIADVSDFVRDVLGKVS
jgi:hypothetical protein